MKGRAKWLTCISQVCEATKYSKICKKHSGHPVCSQNGRSVRLDVISIFGLKVFYFPLDINFHLKETSQLFTQALSCT